MKIGIITLNGLYNLGNRLQNFAVQEILRDYGADTETILYAEHDEKVGTLRKIKDFFRSIVARSGINTTNLYIKALKQGERTLLFRDFTKNHIVTTKKYVFKASKMQRYSKDFDYFCAGSDQIWNPITVQNNSFFFMTFCPSEKCFSFAASIGIDSIPSEYVENYKNGLNHIENISVREKEAAELIKSTVNRDVAVLLDPTLLLEKERWQTVSRRPDAELPEKYIATYFLSHVTEPQKQFFEEFAAKRGLGIVDIMGKYSNKIGPAEFLYIIENSEFVFTDSFHGTAFSLIFSKKFVVFQRNHSYDMSSRITTILNSFKLEDHFFNCNNYRPDADRLAKLTEQIENRDMDHIPEIIAAEKAKASAFLDSVFKNRKDRAL